MELRAGRQQKNLKCIQQNGTVQRELRVGGRQKNQSAKWGASIAAAVQSPTFSLTHIHERECVYEKVYERTSDSNRGFLR